MAQRQLLLKVAHQIQPAVVLLAAYRLQLGIQHFPVRTARTGITNNHAATERYRLRRLPRNLLPDQIHSLRTHCPAVALICRQNGRMIEPVTHILIPDHRHILRQLDTCCQKCVAQPIGHVVVHADDRLRQRTAAFYVIMGERLAARHPEITEYYTRCIIPDAVCFQCRTVSFHTLIGRVNALLAREQVDFCEAVRRNQMLCDVTDIRTHIVVDARKIRQHRPRHHHGNVISCKKPLIDLLLKLRIHDAFRSQNQPVKTLGHDQFINPVLNLHLGIVAFLIIYIRKNHHRCTQFFSLFRDAKQKLPLLALRCTGRDYADQLLTGHSVHMNTPCFCYLF